VDAEQARPPKSPRRAPPGVTPERALALAGVGGLLLTGLVVLIMVLAAASPDKETPVQAAARATPTATPSPTATPKPTPVPLSPGQKAARAAAAKVVTDKGFEVVRLRDYEPRRKLRVLIGRQTSGGRSLAFFFVDDRYIGNDTTSASSEIRVRRKRDTITTLRYKTATRPVDVRFQWDGTQLAPLDAIPPEGARTGLQ